MYYNSSNIPYYGIQGSYKIQQPYNYNDQYPSYNNWNKLSANNKQIYSKPADPKPRSKTWDRIKSLTTMSSKRPKCNNHHYHGYRPNNENYINIPRYREESFGENYVNPYYCPPNQYHIHSSHNQIDIMEKLYSTRHNLPLNLPGLTMNYAMASNGFYEPMENHYQKNHTKKSQKKIVRRKSKNRQSFQPIQPSEKLRLTSQSSDKNSSSNQSQQGRSSSNSSNAYIKESVPKRSRSKPSKLSENLPENTQKVPGDRIKATKCMTTARSTEVLCQDTVLSGSSGSIPRNVIPPAPPMPANEDIFKPSTSLIFKKKAKTHSNLPGETEESFNAVLSELKSRLSQLNMSRKETFQANSINKASNELLTTLNKVPQYSQQNSSSNENLLKILQQGKTLLKHTAPEKSETMVTENPSPLENIENKDLEAKSIHSIYVSNPRLNLEEASRSQIQSELAKSQEMSNWLNSTFSDSNRSCSIGDNNNEKNYSRSKSSLDFSSSSAQTSKTTSMRQVSQSGMPYKLEVYNEFDDVSDDYTKITRQGMSPQRPVENSTYKSNLQFYPTEQSKKTITAFCTNNLFRDSKKFKSNFIRIAQSYSQMNTCQIAEPAEGLLMMLKQDNEINKSLNEHDGLNEYSTISKSFVQKSVNTEEPMKSYESNFKCKTSIPSKFSSFSLYSTTDKSKVDNNIITSSSGSFSTENDDNLSFLQKRCLNLEKQAEEVEPMLVNEKLRNLNEYNQISISMSQEESMLRENSNVKCFEKVQNTNINEYLVEMSNYYRNIQSNIQYRG